MPVIKSFLARLSDFPGESTSQTLFEQHHCSDHLPVTVFKSDRIDAAAHQFAIIVPPVPNRQISSRRPVSTFKQTDASSGYIENRQFIVSFGVSVDKGYWWWIERIRVVR
jgi:hypothetical protein